MVTPPLIRPTSIFFIVRVCSSQDLARTLKPAVSLSYLPKIIKFRYLVSQARFA